MLVTWLCRNQASLLYDDPLRVAWILDSHNGFDFDFLYASFRAPLAISFLQHLISFAN